MNEALRLIPLSEVVKMGVGETVPRTKGVVKAIFERKEGVHAQHGPWSFQNFVLKDGNAEIVCKVAGRDALDLGLKGKQVWVIGFQSEKHGITGIKVDEYNGKKQLNITKTATIATNDGISPQERPNLMPGDQSAPDTQNAPTAPSTQKYIPMGQTIGMAINNACAWLTHQNKPLDPKEVTRISSDLLRVSKWLEAGNLLPREESEPDGVRCIKCDKIVPEVDDTGECPECNPVVPF